MHIHPFILTYISSHMSHYMYIPYHHIYAPQHHHHYHDVEYERPHQQVCRVVRQVNSVTKGHENEHEAKVRDQNHHVGLHTYIHIMISSYDVI